MPELRAILNVAIEVRDNVWRSDVAYLSLPIDENNMDTTLYCKYLNQGLEFIQQHLQKGAVLVHCAAGINRSPTFVIAHLVQTYHWTWEFAEAYVKDRKPNINLSAYLHKKTSQCLQSTRKQ